MPADPTYDFMQTGRQSGVPSEATLTAQAALLIFMDNAMQVAILYHDNAKRHDDGRQVTTAESLMRTMKFMAPLGLTHQFNNTEKLHKYQDMLRKNKGNVLPVAMGAWDEISAVQVPPSLAHLAPNIVALVDSKQPSFDAWQPQEPLLAALKRSIVFIEKHADTLQSLIN